ncbi:MAG: hypothetical protein ACE5HV_05790, partial [Acidobacteriota bacterium]
AGGQEVLERSAAVVTSTWRPSELGGPTGGDLYFDLAAGDTTAADLTGPPVASVEPTGVHRFDPRRQELQATFALAGPGVRRAVDVAIVHNIDVAPTVCAILGIQPPEQAIGRPLGALIVRPPRSH